MAKCPGPPSQGRRVDLGTKTGKLWVGISECFSTHKYRVYIHMDVCGGV